MRVFHRFAGSEYFLLVAALNFVLILTGAVASARGLPCKGFLSPSRVSPWLDRPLPARPPSVIPSPLRLHRSLETLQSLYAEARFDFGSRDRAVDSETRLMRSYFTSLTGRQPTVIGWLQRGFVVSLVAPGSASEIVVSPWTDDLPSSASPPWNPSQVGVAIVVHVGREVTYEAGQESLDRAWARYGRALQASGNAAVWARYSARLLKFRGRDGFYPVEQPGGLVDYVLGRPIDPKSMSELEFDRMMMELMRGGERVH